MPLNENIKNTRVNLNLTLEDLSDLTGISVWSLERYESGKLNVPKINIKKIATCLNTTVDNLSQVNINITSSPKVLENEPIMSINSSSENINSSDNSSSDNLVETPMKSNNIFDINLTNVELVQRYNRLNDYNKNRLLEFLDALEES